MHRWHCCSTQCQSEDEPVRYVPDGTCQLARWRLDITTVRSAGRRLIAQEAWARWPTLSVSVGSTKILRIILRELCIAGLTEKFVILQCCICFYKWHHFRRGWNLIADFVHYLSSSQFLLINQLPLFETDSFNILLFQGFLNISQRWIDDRCAVEVERRRVGWSWSELLFS